MSVKAMRLMVFILRKTDRGTLCVFFKVDVQWGVPFALRVIKALAEI
jgi:hypothetical protein